VHPFEQRVPTTIGTSAIIGGMLAQEVARYLCGWDVSGGEAIVYNGLTLTMHRTSLPRNPNCPYHNAYQDVVEIEFGVNDITARELLTQAEKDLGKPVILELGRDFLLGFHCPECKRYELVNEPLGRVDEARKICTQCGKARDAEVISRLDGSEVHADRTLSELGVPPGEVLAARGGEHLCLYELIGDVTAFWA